MRILLLFLVLVSGSLHAQVGKLFMPETAGSSMADMLATGTEEVLHDLIRKEGGIIKYRIGSITACRGTMLLAEKLLAHPEVSRVQFIHQPGQPLNDQMLKVNGADSVHAGLSGLPKGFTGKGVLVGIIDSGIDPNHPDFKDSLGNSRIRAIWSQSSPFDSLRTPQPYGYGQQWNNLDIDAGLCTHNDQPSYYGHGTNVSGTAAGNGLAVNDYKGVAPESELVVVASAFGSSNWTATVADAVHYIFSLADSLNMPCVVNASIGTYLGSHDATDLAAQAIDSMLLAKSGRAMVCASGNAGNQFFHLGYDVTADTSFTWFQYNPVSALGYGSVYYQLWADTIDFNQVYFSFGADQVSPSYSFRGQTPFFNITNRLGQQATDTIFALSGNTIGIVDTWAVLDGDKYFMEVLISQPDSNQYNFRFSTTGNGHFDIWSASFLGISNMVRTGLPAPSVFPDIIHYKKPDTLQTMVSSWTCSPYVITVGNFTNRSSYTDYSGNTQTFPNITGDIAANSSLGPTRRGILKPDVAATGDIMMSSSRIPTVQAMIINEPWKVAPGGMHNRSGGTSMASPVVAGIAALLFENCPNAGAADIRDFINQSALRDTFTGPVQSYTWGNGKAHALAAIKSTLYNPGLSPAGNFLLCDGETILANTGPAMNHLWSPGDTTATLSITQAGTYSVTTFNQMGCSSYRDSLTVSTVPPPPVPSISVYQDMLTTVPGYSYQWYLNGNPIPGANNQFYLAAQSGDYTVEVSDANGCTTESSIYYHSITGITENVLSGFTVYPNPSSGNFTVNAGEGVDGKLIVRDLSGKMIYEKVYLSGGPVELKRLPAGSYLIELETEAGRVVKKIISL